MQILEIVVGGGAGRVVFGQEVQPERVNDEKKELVDLPPFPISKRCFPTSYCCCWRSTSEHLSFGEEEASEEDAHSQQSHHHHKPPPRHHHQQGESVNCPTLLSSLHDHLPCLPLTLPTCRQEVVGSPRVVCGPLWFCSFTSDEVEDKYGI